MARGRAAGLVLGLLMVVALLGWAETMAAQPLTDVDAAVGEALVVTGSGWEITALQVLTAPGAENVRYPLLVPVAGFLLAVRRWRLALFVAVPTLLISPLTRGLKDVFVRPRPSYAGTTVSAGDWSYPSGHSSGAAVLAGVLLLLLLPYAGRARGWLVGAAVAGALTVGWTRLALGVHYPSDVVAGLALGTASIVLSALFLGGRPVPSAADRSPRTAAGPPPPRPG